MVISFRKRPKSLVRGAPKIREPWDNYHKCCSIQICIHNTQMSFWYWINTNKWMIDLKVLIFGTKMANRSHFLNITHLLSFFANGLSSILYLATIDFRNHWMKLKNKTEESFKQLNEEECKTKRTAKNGREFGGIVGFIRFLASKPRWLPFANRFSVSLVISYWIVRSYDVFSMLCAWRRKERQKQNAIRKVIFIFVVFFFF